MSFIIDPYRYSDDGIPQDNLVLYCRFNNSIADQTGNNSMSSVSISYGNGLYSGASNESVYFNSSTDFVQAADNDLLSFGNGSSDSAFSVSFALKLDSGFSGAQMIATKRSISDSSNLEYDVAIRGDNQKLRLTLYANTTDRLSVHGSTALTHSTNYHVVITYDGSSSISGVRMYLDGVEETYTDTSNGTYTAMSNGTGPLQMGKIRWTSTSHLEGYLDGFGIWNKELTSGEVTAIYNKQSSGTEIL